jgi:hypothetical protein
VGLSPLYCDHFWPVVPAPDDRWGWLWRNWRNEDWQGKPKYSEKTCPSATLSTINPNLTRPRDRTRSAPVGSQQITAWAMARPRRYKITYYLITPYYILEAKLTFHLFDKWSLKPNMPHVCVFKYEGWFLFSYLTNSFSDWLENGKFNSQTWPSILTGPIFCHHLFILCSMSWAIFIFTSRKLGIPGNIIRTTLSQND